MLAVLFLFTNYFELILYTLPESTFLFAFCAMFSRSHFILHARAAVKWISQYLCRLLQVIPVQDKPTEEYGWILLSHCWKIEPHILLLSSSLILLNQCAANGCVCQQIVKYPSSMRLKFKVFWVALRNNGPSSVLRFLLSFWKHRQNDSAHILRMANCEWGLIL